MHNDDARVRILCAKETDWILKEALLKRRHDVSAIDSASDGSGEISRGKERASVRKRFFPWTCRCDSCVKISRLCDGGGGVLLYFLPDVESGNRVVGLSRKQIEISRRSPVPDSSALPRLRREIDGDYQSMIAEGTREKERQDSRGASDRMRVRCASWNCIKFRGRYARYIPVHKKVRNLYWHARVNALYGSYGPHGRALHGISMLRNAK